MREASASFFLLTEASEGSVTSVECRMRSVGKA